MNNQVNSNSIVKSLIYKFAERCGVQGISFIVQLVLARLLDPTDYGVLTLLTIFISISQVFVQSGLNTALIQRKDVTEKDYSSVFYLSLIIACILYFILFFMSPFIADFYNMSQLKKVLRVLALILIPGAFNSIQNAKISREMKFKQLMYCTLISVIISGTLGITMAYMGFGVWALVGQQISNQVSICIIMLIIVKWRPMAVFELRRIKILFSFGWKLLCAALLDTIYNDLRSLVIGKKYNAATLGYYNRGQQFPQLIIRNINDSIQSVMLPALSREQDNKTKMKSMMRRSIVTSSFIIFPLVMGLAVIAEPLVSLLLTDKWLPCVPYLRIACLTFAFYPIHTANLQALNALGRSDKFLQLEIIKKIYGVIILIITVMFFDSPIAIAIGGAITSIISCFVNTLPNRKLLNYSYFEQMEDILPSIIISVVMGIVTYCVIFLGFSNVFTLIFQVSIGIIVYIGLAWIFKLECFMYLKDMIVSILKRPANKSQ